MTKPADYPQPRQFPGDGIRLSRQAGTDAQAAKAARAKGRLLSSRLVQDGERSYTAYSADEIIAIDSEANHGRPGHLYA